MGTKCISILMRRCKDHIGSHPPSVLICRLSPISEQHRYGPEPVLAPPYRLWDSIDTHINASGVDLAVRGPDLFGHINMLRLCWNCACTSELLYLHRLYTLESPALSFRGARVRNPLHIYCSLHFSLAPFAMTSAPGRDSQSFRVAPSATLVCRLRTQFSTLTLLRQKSQRIRCVLFIIQKHTRRLTPHGPLAPN